ncbi:Tetratricopeptide repeat protein 35 [Chelonia mydas]|uniref:ER membrane protein complex subunit 2 n=1 Tax=Chelonia mydas TaxID=8469 RepID=M7BEY4_CHEMY|nr:Tetratricopeptide repeat protein 35 [Chelonia mydas]
MRDKMRKWREENHRNSEQIVEVGEELINEYASKLGDDIWIIYEQVMIAALDCSRDDLALFCLQELRRQFPGSHRVKRLTGMRFEYMERYDDALQLYDRILQEDSTNTEAGATESRVLFLKIFVLSVFERHLHKYDTFSEVPKVSEFLLMGMRIATLVVMPHATYHFGSGSILRATRKRKIAIRKAQGKNVEAIRELNEYLEQFVGDQEAWHELAELYINEHDRPYISEVGRLWLLARQGKPLAGRDVLFTWSVHSHGAPQLPVAAVCCSQNGEPWSQGAKGLHACRHSSYAKAAFCLEELMMTNPHNHLYCQQFAEVKYTQGGLENLELSRKYFAQALKLNNRNMRALFGLYMSASHIASNPKASAKMKKDNMKYASWAANQINRAYQSIVYVPTKRIKLAECILTTVASIDTRSGALWEPIPQFPQSPLPIGILG